MLDIKNLEAIAKAVRHNILTMTTKAGSGHPTSSLSAAELMTALFFDQLKYDLNDPQNPNNDRVIFSKGHASPLFYSLYRAAGVVSDEELHTYREFNSELEGHPTPRFKYAEAATGSLGQGLSIGLGMALAAKLDELSYKTYVLLGDSEMAEGSVWEAMELASFHKVSNLIAILDINRLGQSRPTMLEWDTDKYKARVEAFGWRSIVVDGHDFSAISEAYSKAQEKSDQPCAILAKTIKGKGISFLENKEGWHGKALSKEDLDKALAELGEVDLNIVGKIALPSNKKPKEGNVTEANLPTYKLGEQIATRKAYGETIAALGQGNEAIVCLDGETSNSTFSEIFRDKNPNRYFEMFIAEQNMVGTALGLSKRGKIPFASTFSAFWTRTFDQIRMSSYSQGNVKFIGSHSGVSIGEDGASQMALEDISLFRSVFNSVVLCPSDANSTVKLVAKVSDTKGINFIRTSRPATPVIYKEDEEFEIGGSKVLRSSDSDKAVVVACGVTVFEAIVAADELAKDGINIRVIDAYSIKPMDEKTLMEALKTSKIVITVEDHYKEGGLGDAVLSVFAQSDVILHKLAVTKMPMSGKGEELLAYEEINAESIVKKVKEALG